MKTTSFGEECLSVQWKATKNTKFSKNLKNFFKKHKFLKFLLDLAELPMVSLGQEPLGGAKHSQKTSKSCGFFPANHLLYQEIPFGKMKTQTNYKNCKNIWNFDQNALFNRFLWHNMAPVRPKITSRNQKRYKIFCILITITYGTRKHTNFSRTMKKV